MTAYVRATLRKLTLWYEHSVTIMVVLQRETYSDVHEQEEEFDACELSDGYASTVPQKDTSRLTNDIKRRHQSEAATV